MCGVHVYTSFTFSYLQRARVLAQTLRWRHPDWVFWGLITDQIPDGVDISVCLHEFDFIKFSDTLGISNYTSWLFKHDIVEACTAVKGAMMCHILQYGAKKIIYLDPDIAVFHDLSNIESALDNYSIILTPHQTEPNVDSLSMRDNELMSLQYGVYNLGFIAIRNDAPGAAFAHWWAGRLYDACYDEPQNGIFTDQKYCDLVPGLFPNVLILRDAGYNVASWNLSKRDILIDVNGNIYVNGSLLRFYHFTKINSVGDAMTERYARGHHDVFELWNWYKRQIAENEIPRIPHKWWAYSHYAGGVPIKKAAREFYRSSEELMRTYDNPFDVGVGTFYEFLQREHPDLI